MDTSTQPTGDPGRSDAESAWVVHEPDPSARGVTDTQPPESCASRHESGSSANQTSPAAEDDNLSDQIISAKVPKAGDEVDNSAEAQLRLLEAKVSRLQNSTLALEEAKREAARRVQALEAERMALSERLAESKAQALRAKESREVSAQRAKDAQEKLKAARELYLENRGKLLDSLNRTRESLKNSSSLWEQAKRYYSLFWQGLFADEITKSDVDLGADTYLCLLPSTVPAAMELRRKYGGRIICDCVENVEVERHSLAPNLHPPTLDMINLNAYGALSTVDGIMTVSRAVEKTLRRFGPPVRLQPNFRRYEEPAPSGKLRDMFDLPSDSKVLVASGGIVGGFEAVIDAMELLPPNIHLVTFAKFSAPGYDERVRDYVESKGLGSRIHLSGFVPYEELSSLLADADVGLIVLDPSNPNHSVSLPNRVFDFTTAALPFVAPNVSEIAEYIERYQCGETLADVKSRDWADGIASVLNNLQGYRDAVVSARSEATWESLDDGLIDFLGNPNSVTLLGFRDLSRYQRLLRVTDSLTQRGISVNAAFFSKDPRPIDNDQAKFYYFSERYGRGPGLIPVPKKRDPA